MIVSDYIINRLEKAGVKYVYGCIGGAITYLVDSIYKNDKIQFIHTYNEQAASYSASAAAKLTGNLSVAIATSGPGATNMITGIADAYFDSAPVLFITGQVNTYDYKYNKPIRQQGFQETDIVNITKPITKYSVILDNPETIIDEIEKAIQTALNGRPGPVVIDIPLNIQRTQLYQKNTTLQPTQDKLKQEIQYARIMEYYKQSKKPILLLGGGCQKPKIRDHITYIADELNIPVAVTLMGKENFPHNHKLYAGFIGSYGNRYGNLALAKSDLLIVLGSRLDTRQVGNETSPFENKKIIHIDIDPDENETRFKNKENIVTDVNQFIQDFAYYIKTNEISPNKNTQWVNSVQTWKEKFLPSTEPTRAKKDNFHYLVMQEISDNLKPDDIICTDIGQNQMLAAQVINIIQDQRFVTSGGMAPMGYGLPAGISTSLESNKRVIVITGDGGLQMNIQELNAVDYLRSPLIIFVFNNKSLGMIKQFQYLYFDSRYYGTDKQSGYQAPDFEKIAQAYNINSIKIERENPDWRAIIRQILEKEKPPILVNIELNEQTFIYPKLEYTKPISLIDPPLAEDEILLLNIDEENN
jgi:acetolactate synthase-1/2/3 large subunit